MFIEQKKKRNYRTFIYSAIIVVLCLLIIVIAWPAETAADTGKSGTDQQDLQSQLPVNSQTGTGDDEENDDGDDDKNYEDNDDEDYEDDDRDNEENNDHTDYPSNDENSHITENPDISNAASTYYLVKKADGRIKVFFIDEQGNQIELETTEIIYDMLGTEDQKLFDEGFVVKNQEELAVLLQDFES